LSFLKSFVKLRRIEREAFLTQTGKFAGAARHLGKAGRTRARLMDAAVRVFAREGFEAASVNSIAREADVVNGTFYLHFKDKDEIATAVAFQIAANVTRRLNEAMVGTEDAVERVSSATRRFVELASAEPDWGWALFRAAWFFRELRGGVVAFLKSDLQRGHRQGAFKVEVDDFLIDMFASMTLTALLGRLQGTAGADAGSRAAELQLRMLGVPPARAKKAAWRKLPPLALSLFEPPRRENDNRD
jgi:AcrR family transcriptional regulator